MAVSKSREGKVVNDLLQGPQKRTLKRKWGLGGGHILTFPLVFSLPGATDNKKKKYVGGP